MFVKFVVMMVKVALAITLTKAFFKFAAAMVAAYVFGPAVLSYLGMSVSHMGVCTIVAITLVVVNVKAAPAKGRSFWKLVNQL